jgi:cholesterol transport system auxiliary component
MNIRIRPAIFLLSISLIISSLVACVSLNKTKPNIAIYDFGLSVPTENPSENNQPIISKIFLEEPVAAESLQNNKIRYRLNYQNSLRVFYYSESRWAATPAELFASKLSKMVSVANNPMTCSLKLKIEAFDHVFQTPSASEGLVQLSVSLIEKKSKKIISSQLITESVTSASPNAQGGTAALQQASENALKKVINWGNAIADRSELCH